MLYFPACHLRTLAVSAVLLLITAVGCSRSPEARARGGADNPIAVRSYPVEEEVIRRPVQAVGSPDEIVRDPRVRGRYLGADFELPTRRGGATGENP